MTVLFRITSWAQSTVALASLRSIVFIAEQDCPYHEEFDGLDDDALHVLGEHRSADGDTPIACGRIRMLDAKTAKLERLAVLKSFRGQSYGFQLLNTMIAAARQQDATMLKLHAQLHAQAFYERAGFVGQGPVFDEVGIAHRRMTRPINLASGAV